MRNVLSVGTDGIKACTKSEDDFLDKLAALKSKWESTEDKFRQGTHSHPSFHVWFVAYQSNVMMKTMMTPVRQ